MAIITLTTDLGSTSHYLAIVKGMLLHAEPKPEIIDISHDCEPFDIIESAYVFNLVNTYFPPNTIHIFGVNYHAAQSGRILVAKSHDQYILVPDNGALSLIYPDHPVEVWEVAQSPLPPFAIANVMVKNALAIRQNEFQLDKLYPKLDKYHKVGAIKAVISDNKLTGTIMYNDSYGNAHTNITKSDFENFTSNNKFRINLSRHEWVEEVRTSFARLKGGDPICKFNNKDLLMIGVARGKSTQLLNLTKNKTISVELL